LNVREVQRSLKEISFIISSSQVILLKDKTETVVCLNLQHAWQNLYKFTPENSKPKGCAGDLSEGRKAI